MQAGDEIAVSAEGFDHSGPDPGHDVHVANDIGTIRNLHANLRDGRPDGPHGKWNDVHRATPHGAVVEARHGLFEFYRP